MPEQPQILTSIVIEFERDTPDPARVFRAMSGLINTLIELDRNLAKSVAVSIEPVVLLEDIQASSLKAVLRTILRSVHDEALLNLEWQPLVGQYLVRAKHAILRRLGDHDTIASKPELQALQQDLLLIAEQTNVVNVHLYEPLPPSQLLHDLESLSAAVSQLLPEDKAVYTSQEGSTPINTGFHLSPEQVEDLLTDEILQDTSELILKIKKPDYLGASMWDFSHAGRVLQAKILDEDWLRRFQTRQLNVRPGDSLRVLVRSEIKRTADGTPVASRHFVVRVLEVIEAEISMQDDLFPPEVA